MYYRFYVDQFFLEQFFIGVLLLELTAALRKRRVSRKRLVIGSLVNAAFSTALICLGVPGGVLSALAGVFLSAVLVFPERNPAGLFRSMLWMGAVTVCFGGAAQALLSLIGIPLLLCAAICAGLLRLLFSWLERHLKLGGILDVQLVWEGHRERARGLVDSGNLLTEPLTGQPVSIVDAALARRLLGQGWETRRGFFLIPFHSLGRKQGWMQGVTIDRMEFCAGGAVVLKPVLAVYQGKVSTKNQYQIILHPMHLRAGS